MIKSKLKKPGCLISVGLIIVVIIGFVAFHALMNSIVYFIFTWPIWLGKAFLLCLEFSQESLLHKLIISSSFILLALLLYRLKRGAVLIFGVLEFVGGVFVIWGSLTTPSGNNLTNAIALGAGFFLMVQGAENCSNGYIKDNEKTQQERN